MNNELFYHREIKSPASLSLPPSPTLFLLRGKVIWEADIRLTPLNNEWSLGVLPLSSSSPWSVCQIQEDTSAPSHWNLLNPHVWGTLLLWLKLRCLLGVDNVSSSLFETSWVFSPETCFMFPSSLELDRRYKVSPWKVLWRLSPREFLSSADFFHAPL